jgi:pentatricopeptide repeat protein
MAAVYMRIVTCDIADTAMGNLALSFNDIGNHTDALVLLEKVLQFRRRVLPKDHPDIGDVRYMPFVQFIGVTNASTAGVAMSNIAHTLGKVGRWADALKLFEEAMEFRIHVLPEEHPEIGEVDSQLLC